MKRLGTFHPQTQCHIAEDLNAQQHLCGNLESHIYSWPYVPYNEVLSCVPQGSVFGPLLSDVFVNDLHSSFKELKYVLFAEDVKNFCTLCSEFN